MKFSKYEIGISVKSAYTSFASPNTLTVPIPIEVIFAVLAACTPATESSKPIHFAGAYMDLTENPALFTVVNKNTSEIYYELVEFDQQLAQSSSDRAVNILTASKAGDILPRIANSKDFYLCKFCEFRETCWKDK